MLEELESGAWTPGAAAHLLNRAGFGGSPSEIETLHKMGLEGAVGCLLEGDEDADLFPAPGAAVLPDMTGLREKLKAMTQEERDAFQKETRQRQRRNLVELRAWWLNRMRWGLHPAREKALLFWHGHWATSVEKVKEPFLMWQQNETLRASALGSFRTMAHDLTRDPAMMRYLDVPQSRKGQPNENFARELMELFTLGEGHYTEDDIRESARAFTGYRVDLRNGQFRMQASEHDGREKTFFGKTGAFGGNDILDLILENPQASRFLARKLWVYYAGTEPAPGLLDALAAAYLETGLDTGRFLAKIFRSAAFYSPAVVRRQVKGPVQWLVGTCRALEIPLPGAAASEGILRQLGQMPFEPPNVKGWDGGRAWISSATLLLRYNIAGYFVSGKAAGLPGVRGGEAKILKVPLGKVYAGGKTPEALCEAAGWRLFQSPLPAPLQAKAVDYLATHGTDEESLRDLLHLMMSTPEFQLT